ncbi:MAG: ribosomal L7Ae/L30e/S12e/Gadd45 family protein [Oscillospiraceae bacterium]|jgi:ribosomal protein L7Ae-like RNA K-turn-binding protein|nr:ribosomal L7Ae/L30e/S12e/Gadd45 family protein [Oscillospiraceae bacterium]
MNDRFLSLLGLARRAGKCELGFDAAKESIIKNKSRLLVLASDISPNTEKNINFFASENGTTTVFKTEYTEEDLYGAIGKSVKIISLTDSGFAKKALALLNEASGKE